jgi:hypothetical protein
MTGYTKLFGSIVASTIWRENDKTRIVWITMLAMANKHGDVEASIPGLSDLSRVSIADTEAALAALAAPDAYSRTKDYEGRRIEPIDGGWHILNHAKYREKMSKDERREYLAQKKREQRARDKGKSVNNESTNVQNGQQTSTGVNVGRDIADAEESKKESVREAGWPTLSEVKAFAMSAMASEECAEHFWNAQEQVGWMFKNQPVRNWRPGFTNFVTNWKAEDFRRKGQQSKFQPVLKLTNERTGADGRIYLDGK